MCRCSVFQVSIGKQLKQILDLDTSATGRIGYLAHVRVLRLTDSASLYAFGHDCRSLIDAHFLFF